MRYVVVGAGGIGGLAGSWMTRAGCDVTFVERWAEHVEAINRDGMVVDGIVAVMRTGVRVHPGESLVTLATEA